MPERIFYVRCPMCDGRFCCHGRLRHVEVLLLCPFCGHRFPQEESRVIEE